MYLIEEMIVPIKNKITPIIFIGVIILKIGVINSFSQVPTQQQEEQTEQLIENIAEQSETEFENESLLEQMDYFKEHPVNLNKTTREQLLEFGLLSEIQINSLIKHREKNGDLIAIYELQSVEHFDLATIQRIIPFVNVHGKIEDYRMPVKDLLVKGKNQFFIRYQTFLEADSTHGYLLNKTDDSLGYLGSPVKLYARYRYSFGNKISYGITAEKDAGEEFFKGSQKKGFDFYSAHFVIHDVSIFKTVAVGDYEVKFGQGLIAYQGIGFGKSPSVMNLKKGVQFLRQYTSSIEANFMRGAGATATYKNFYLTSFISHRGVDANVSQVDSSDNDEVRAVSSLLDDGYHRTKSEFENKNSIRQTVFGSTLSFEKRNFHLGITGMNTRLSVPLLKNIQPYNQFDFSGKSLTNFGADYSLLIQNFNFFGEFAQSRNDSGKGGIAMLNGVLISLDQKIDIGILNRNYQRNYQTLFSNAFAESTRPVNESGTYFSITFKPVREWRADAYFDSYKFPWMKYQVDGPSDGYDVLTQITYKPNKVLEMYGRAKYETKSVNAPASDAPIDFLVYNKKTNLRYHITYKISKSFTLKTRVESAIWNDGANENQYGYMLYQDVNFKALNSPLSFAARFGIFDVDDYDARIYTYENDVLYAFSIPAFSGKGIRFYLLTRYQMFKGIDLEIRFAQTYYPEEKTISSGNDMVSGNKKSEVKAQLRWVF